MNLIEAVRSGKRYRLKHSETWYDPAFPYNSYSRGEILTDDWEIQEEKIEVTKEQAMNALCRYFAWERDGFSIKYTRKGERPTFEKMNLFLKDLGFKE